MFFFRRKKEPSACKDSSVNLVKNAYVRSLEMVQQSGPLSIYQKPVSNMERRSVTDNTPLTPLYELILLWSCKYFSLCRTTDHRVAVCRFGSLLRLVTFLCTGTKRNQTNQMVHTLQRLINALLEHPNWQDVHLAAFTDNADFFTKISPPLTADELNCRIFPDLYTPLHIAILQGYVSTVEALLRLKPDLSLTDALGNSILYYAVHSPKPLLDKLLAYPSAREHLQPLLVIRNDAGLDPVTLAVTEGMKDSLQSLMNFGLTVRMLTVVWKPSNTSRLTAQQEFLNRLDNETILNFKKADFEELDLTHLSTGGCPLHWARGTIIVEKLLHAGFALDTPNLFGETPLAVMVMRNRFKVALALLYNGADANKLSYSGHGPLHVAVKCVNISLVKALLVFGADINLLSTRGHSARHMAALGVHPNHKTILRHLQEMGAEPCKSSSCVKGCTLVCPKNLPKSTPFNFNPKHRLLERAILEGTLPRPRTKPSLMVCIDGGGVRGLFTVQVMLELEKYLKGASFAVYYDWISGTSTGSMIAISLTIGKSLTEVRRMYFTFKDEVMKGKKPYNADKLETLFIRELGGQMKMSQCLETYGKKVLVFGTRIDREPPELTVFRSYALPEGIPGMADPMVNCQVWKALRASTAAPSFFKPQDVFIDGGLIANNPTVDSLKESLKYQAAARKVAAWSLNSPDPSSSPPDPPSLKLVLSFGNVEVHRKKDDFSSVYSKLHFFHNVKSCFRLERTRAFRILKDSLKQLKTLATYSNDHVVHRADSWCSAIGCLFYRLNPTMARKYSLDETNDRELIKGLWDVKLWCRANEAKLREIAAVMDSLRDNWPPKMKEELITRKTTAPCRCLIL